MKEAAENRKAAKLEHLLAAVEINAERSGEDSKQRRDGIKPGLRQAVSIKEGCVAGVPRSAGRSCGREER